MTPADLLKICRRPSPLDGEIPSHIYLTVTRKNLPSGSKIRLLGAQGGPMGRICTVNQVKGGYTVVAVFPRAGVEKIALQALEELDAE